MGKRKMNKFVAYYRVSTAKQGQSGLGLEAQQAAVEAFVEREGAKLVAPPFVEVESGTIKERPELAKAIAHARRNKAKLLVAKMDRLSRNLAFLAHLMESGVDFVAVDNPHANKLTVHILAAVAEEEARAISARTTAALQAAKARGVALGSARPGHWEGREESRTEGQKKATIAAAKAKRAKHLEAIADLIPELVDLQGKGLSLRAIAAEMNAKGSTTTAGKPWNPMAVKRAIETAR